MPFQRRTSGAPLDRPTATTADADSATTSVSSPPPVMVGVATRLHAVPLKRATYGCAAPVASEDDPTAHTSLEVRASTPANAVPAGAGGAIEAQVVPFQRNASGTRGPPRCRIRCCPPADESRPPIQ